MIPQDHIQNNIGADPYHGQSLATSCPEYSTRHKTKQIPYAVSTKPDRNALIQCTDNQKLSNQKKLLQHNTGLQKTTRSEERNKYRNYSGSSRHTRVQRNNTTNTTVQPVTKKHTEPKRQRRRSGTYNTRTNDHNNINTEEVDNQITQNVSEPTTPNNL